ncbi:MAG: hypothetical protein KY475_10915 [Planctomycetes bacterium]|nr:hypothetical protein [Planctomycetota bacterium]
MTSTAEQIEFVRHITTRPSMWVVKPSYASICNYLLGFDAARDGALLAGFKEWLTMRLGYGHNYCWDRLVMEIALGPISHLNLQLDNESDAKCTGALRDLLTEYLELRGKIGLRNILYDHGCWMRNQDWFDENVERYGSSAGTEK